MQANSQLPSAEIPTSTTGTNHVWRATKRTEPTMLIFPLRKSAAGFETGPGSGAGPLISGRGGEVDVEPAADVLGRVDCGVVADLRLYQRSRRQVRVRVPDSVGDIGDHRRAEQVIDEALRVLRMRRVG